MDKIAVAKSVLRFIASIAVSAVINNAVKMNTPADADSVNRALTVVGGFIIGGMVSDKGADYALSMVEGFRKTETPVVPPAQV
jgi:hypothetical protein